MSRSIGNAKEQLALQFLKRHNLKVLERNFHSYRGEIDLICRDGQTIVFIEVRYRRKGHYGDGLESVHYAKQQRIIQTAEHYLQRHNWTHRYPCRFDVIAIDDNPEAPIQWVKNAFICS